MPTRLDLETLLREQFGHDDFRPGQERIIRSLLRGRDVLAVMPTGAGKSLIFQLTAQLLPGITVVVSPLIALMKDQVDAATERGLPAAVINSTQTASQLEESLQQAERGELKLLYVTPERFEKPEFVERLRAIGVSLLAVDECHCISEWGYDFRPAYLTLKGVVEQLDRPTLLALTATATPWVRRDITERLGMRDPEVSVHGVDRANLFFEVCSVRTEDEDQRVLRALMLGDEEGYPAELARPLRSAMQGCGIIYCLTTAATEETAGWLRDWGIEADYYHGQRTKSERERVQNGFMSGELRVIAATNAFGLGIDKPDVRFVIHRDVPASLEAYFQEAGRAGRDGEPARCTLIYRPADLGRAAFLAAGSTVSGDDLNLIRVGLREQHESTVTELTERIDPGAAKVRRALETLARRGIVELEGDSVRLLRPDFDPEKVSLEAEESRKAYEKSRVQMMRGYAESWDCRRHSLLSYFGEELGAERCDYCDNDCRTDRRGEAEPEPEPIPFQVGTEVRHTSWGPGEVTACDNGAVTVNFAAEGEKTLATELVLERNLLEVVAAPPNDALPENPPGKPPFQVGESVEHEGYGTGEVQRVTETAVVVLFEKAGYHTLDLERVMDQELLTSSDER